MANETKHPHAEGKAVGMEYLRMTQIVTTCQQRDLLFKMIQEAIDNTKNKTT